MSISRITTPKLATILTVAAPLTLLSLGILTLAPAKADDWDDRDCRVAADASRIESNRAIAIGESLGYKIEEFEIDDGCIELKGSDRTGARIKLRLDPVTGEVIPYRR